ncbi:tyrosine-protein kinase wzc [Enterobacter cloacae]|uniref:Tyrosine-protein kinase wzc n=1 Tax=Enterobacter cloacae TaxID=550 RepID=A0A377LWB6_ENTCL|nr:tyrosine-protein kinase wzc [Enterobacter cloacae]
MFAAAAIVYTLFATPIYSADALVQIEQNTGNSLVQDIGSALANKPPASEAEIQLIQSRLVLGKTVHDLGLDISVTKNTFPIFGAGWDRLTGHSNDTVKVTDFVLPKGSADQTFTLTVLGPKQYQLTSDAGFSARGEVGQMLTKDGVSMKVSAIQAQGRQRVYRHQILHPGDDQQSAKQPDGHRKWQGHGCPEHDLYR